MGMVEVLIIGGIVVLIFGGSRILACSRRWVRRRRDIAAPSMAKKTATPSRWTDSTPLID